MASVPMVADGACVGGLLVSYGAAQEFAPEHRAFLSAFAAQVSQALRRGLAYQEQQSAAEQLLRSLMPHSLPELAGLTLGAHYQPGGIAAEVGGDWYDVLELPDGSAVLALGDVMGRGVEAAIVMSEVRSATRAYALLDPDPAVVFARLDRLVATLPFGEQIVAMLYGLVDPERSSVRLGVAGHLPPLLVPRSGRPQLLENDLGAALGTGVGPWPTHTVSLADGSLLFYSDGLVANRRQDPFARIEVLRDHVEGMAPRRRNPRELCARLSSLMPGPQVDDDVTMLAITASHAQPTVVCELPADASAAPLARRFVTSVLREWQLHGDVVDTAELCVSELVTNAVIHSRTTSTVTVRRDGEYLVVMVQDRGGPVPVHPAEGLDPEAISGRGLSLVDALTSAWSAEHTADGTTVWFELLLNPAQAGAPDTWSHLAS
jgi:serine phosphatase RsbU (regulator of sigma subunit)/anti-sigma regulatory factor (Ser/Thr protein kinase)